MTKGEPPACRQMNLAGGSWIWSASLRFVFMLPILSAIVALRGLALVLIGILLNDFSVQGKGAEIYE